ncbi:hypothetical protein [Paracoccus aminophilus]|uniref:Uncharacterized protein n=1 Tax=Paracoccus aminophilus JCM 7686 TaxID=1367847 RepID=S5XZX7_PARAH|nr:hypothetical protein [Paracoccus aminophilus]AGT08990.1 hypothetical protein JCM7686_1889 [Paracoccus aminophilus JCM 7686]
MTRPFRRRVFYLPGYDPIPARRYRELYRREGILQAEISGYGLSFGPRQERTGFGWGVLGAFEEGLTETEVEVLVWADLVQASMGQSIAATYGQLWRTAKVYIGSGAIFRLMRLRKGPVIAALYPLVVLILQALVALTLALVLGALAGAAVVWLMRGLAPAQGWLHLPLAVALGVPLAILIFRQVLRFWQRIDGRLFAYYLMHDYAFTAHLGGAYPPALETRLAYFRDRIARSLAGDWDEVLVVGHSSGAYLAVSVLADLLRAEPRREDGPALGLLTLGHVVPMASFLPKAARLRADLHDLAAAPGLTWVDVTAPGDPCSFGLCDPVAVSGVAPPDPRGPLVLSAAFTQTLSPEMRRALRGHWFRLHFQYLHAFDRPGDYDYFAITAGPLTLAARFSGRAPSPGRIVTPANRYTSRAVR